MNTPAQTPQSSVIDDPHAALLLRQQKIAENVPNIVMNFAAPTSKSGKSEKTEEVVRSGQSGKSPNGNAELIRADIFKLLGMKDLAEAEKKKNLEEMEETIWQDFVENDLPLFLPQEERTKFFDFLKTKPSTERIINYFGKRLPPDFEKRYLDKTLEFKEAIVKEQIETLLATNEGKDPQKTTLLTQVKAAAEKGEWKKAEELMASYSQS